MKNSEERNGLPSKESSYPDLTNGTPMAKTDGDKLKLFAEQFTDLYLRLKLTLRIRI